VRGCGPAVRAGPDAGSAEPRGGARAVARKACAEKPSGQTRTRMQTYYVSLTVSRPAGLDDEALIRLLHDAAKRAACVAIEVKPAGLVIEADAAALQSLEETIRELVRERGGEVDRITVTRI